MKMEYISSMVFVIFLLGICNATEDNIFYYKASDEKLDVKKLLSEIKPTVKNLDLGGHKEVDDNFIKDLSNNDKSKSIININLSGTSITVDSLINILEGKIGTRKDLPQISSRYDMPASEIHLDISNTTINDYISKQYDLKPFYNVHLEYRNPFTQKKSAKDEIGIKMLNIRNEN